MISPSASRTDRIMTPREYAAVPSLRRYVILESSTIGLTVLERPEAHQNWALNVLTSADKLDLPELGLQIAVLEFYQDIDLAGDSIPA